MFDGEFGESKISGAGIVICIEIGKCFNARVGVRARLMPGYKIDKIFCSAQSFKCWRWKF